MEPAAMPPRKPPKVSLAPIGERRAVAESAIRKFEAQGSRRSEAPTPERLLKAGGAARVERIIDTTVVMDGSRTAEVEIEAVRVRVDDDPFARLCNGKIIDRRPARNLALCNAGLRYRQAWQSATAGNIRGARFAEHVDGGKGAGLFGTESAAGALQAFRKMRAAVRPRALAVLDAIVLREADLVDAGRQFTGYKAEIQARTCALTLLSIALESVAEAIGIIEPEPAPEPPALPIAAE
ncbi:hypothetical protein CQW49_08445 [Methylosinus trichosporium OB3b]|uniref:Uncharacterized protein n=2 Tax=Methylosinus trichosporium TaxID=426 RepID=A0A2D2CYT8_METT3|nr:hypothetical protein CQW49_08445 [Methylosinus trichosporium OB3b]OBS54014.1 hypothetical protein A8B73_02870 [Methylosinus sp. 3S-1]